MTKKNQHVNCPVCGAEVPISCSSGRKPLNLTVTNVCDSLRLTRSIQASAEELDCSRAYIYKVLKQQGITLDDVLTRVTPKRTRGEK